MDRVEELLRDELRRDSLPSPAAETMLSRVARVRRRRRAAGAGSAAVVLVGLVAAAVTLRLPGPGSVPAGDTPPPRQYTDNLINVVFTDNEHGYAVQQGCSLDIPGPVPDGAPTPDVHRQCTSQLLVTVNGGRSWQERALPGDPAFKDAGVLLLSGHSLMLWVDGQGALALGGRNRKYWTTTDGAQTWQQAPAPRDTGPAGSLAWFGPGDTLTFLATYPPGGPDTVGDKNLVVAATDGSFWVACPQSSCVHVTRDRGQTWVTQTPVPSATAVDWVSTVDGQRVYAAIRTGSGSQLVRSTDGGTTWAGVPGLTGLPEHSMSGLALPDGGLLMTRVGPDGGMYRLANGATTVERLTGAPAHPAVVYRTGGVVVAATAWGERNPMAWVSQDGGTTWLAVPPPPV